LKGAVIGALWGLGHSLSSSILGSLVYFLKGEINHRFHLFKKLSIIADFVVGLTLISIGIVGIKESRSLLNQDNQENVAKSFATSFSVFVNGFLHGFSWDGIPSLAPTLTLQSFQSVLSFLAAYSIGTMVTMSLCGALVSMISDNLLKGSKDERRAMNTLSFISSIFAVFIGIYWVIQGIAS
jgi:cytochrome c biogenesis protein CcdA